MAAWCTTPRTPPTGSRKKAFRPGGWPGRPTPPLDEETILESLERTGRLVVVDEANPRCSIATDIAALAAQKAFHSLKAPIELVTAPHTPAPFAGVLEDLYIPSADKIAAAVKKARS